MTTFTFAYDHATALSHDLEKAAGSIREPAPPVAEPSVAAKADGQQGQQGQQEFRAALERATTVTATHSRRLARRLQQAADSGFTMVRDAQLAESSTIAESNALADALPGRSTSTSGILSNEQSSNG